LILQERLEEQRQLLYQFHRYHLTLTIHIIGQYLATWEGIHEICFAHIPLLVVAHTLLHQQEEEELTKTCRLMWLIFTVKRIEVK